MQQTPAEKLILRIAREELETLEGSHHGWQDRAGAISRAAKRLGVDSMRVAQVYDRNRDES